MPTDDYTILENPVLLIILAVLIIYLIHLIYKRIHTSPFNYPYLTTRFDVSGKKKVPPADADGTLVSGLGKINVSFAAACFIPNASLAFPC